MAVNYFSTPGIRYQGSNINALLEPIMSGISEGRQRSDKIAEQQRQQANADRQFGLQRESMDFRRAQATREAAMAAERMRMQQEQHGQSMDMRRQQMGLERERFGLTKTQFDEERKQRGAQRAGRLALAILNDSDQARAAANWQKMVQASPQFAEQLQRYGQDPSDWRSGARFIAVEAGMLPEEQADQRKVMEVNGRLVRVGSSGPGEVVYESPEDDGGGVYESLKERAGVEEGLRKEVTKASADYETVATAANGLAQIAQAPTAASDIAMVFQFMKVLDPSSTVRESEYESAAGAAGVPGRVISYITKIKNGRFLTDEQRAEFLQVAQTLARARQNQYSGNLQRYRGIAERLRVDPRNVIPEPMKLNETRKDEDPAKLSDDELLKRLSQ